MGTLYIEVTMDKRELVRNLERRFRTLQEVRKLNEERRWYAMALANHRTQSASLSPSPVPEIVRQTDVSVNAIEDFENFFIGNLVSPNINWLGIQYKANDMTSQDDIVGANDFIGEVRNAVLDEMASSNFYPSNELATKDMHTGACAAVLVRNDPNADDKRGRCVYTVLTPWQFWVDTDQYGEYDTLFYKKTMNVAQAYEMFGEKLPEWMKNIIEKGDPFEQWYDFLLCIYPRNKMYRRRTVFAKQKKFAVVWMYLNGASTTVTNTGPSEIIDESGSDYFPVNVGCWMTDGDNPYGTSPVMRNMVSIDKLDGLSYETMLTLQKMNHPAYTGVQASLEGFSDDPGSRNAVTSPELAPQPIQLTQNVEGAFAVQEKQEQAVQKMFRNDIFNYLSRQDMQKVYTATQVNAVKAEQLSLLASDFGSYGKWIEGLVTLTILTMSENGRLPKGASEILKGNGKTRIFIESTLAQELRAYTNRDANIALLEQCASFVNLQQFEALDNYDMDEIARGIGQGLGVDHKVIKDKMKVQIERDMRAQMQQKQMELQNSLTQSEINRNNAGASNYNNANGANQYGG